MERSRYPARWTYVVCALAAITAGGCSTLSNLGLPFGSSQNKLLKTAGKFSQQAVLPAAWPSELSRESLAGYTLEPGDTLLIEPANFDSPARFPGDQTIMPDGMISLGKYGQHQAAGKTLGQLQDEIQDIVDRYEQRRRDEATTSRRLETASPSDRIPETPLQDVQPDVGPITVRLIGLESLGYYVLGEVNSPGRFVLTGRETVLDAIIEAGGITDEANRHQIILSRPSSPCGERVVVPICYDHITQLGDTSTNYQIRPGDRVFVSSQSFWDDLRASILPGKNECCPACGPPQCRAWIPSLNCVTGFQEQITETALPSTEPVEEALPTPATDGSN